MALWSNTDEANSAPQYTVDVVTGNTGVQAFEQTPVGTFGVDELETQQDPSVTHAGWVLRTEGTGDRAGRVFNETLVAMSSISTDSGSADDKFVSTVITITADPESVTANANDNVVFTVVATSSNPSVALGYQWYDADGDSELVGETAASLELDEVQLGDDGSVYYVVVSAAGADSVQSANATLTVV